MVEATEIEAEIERSEIAAQSPAAKRVALMHRRVIHAMDPWEVYRGRCRLELLGPPWVRESTSHLFKISEFERTGRGPPAQQRALMHATCGCDVNGMHQVQPLHKGVRRRIRISFNFRAADAKLPRRGQNTPDRSDREISDGRRWWKS